MDFVGDFMQATSQITFCMPAILWAATAAIIDLRCRRIPNWLTGSLAILSLVLHGVYGGWEGVGSALCGLLFCTAIFVSFYLVGGMGAGDIKLLAAEGGLLGISNSLAFVISTAIFGALFALGMAYAKGRLCQTLRNTGSLVNHHKTLGLAMHPELNLSNAKTLRLPYALAIVSGVTFTSFLQPIARWLQ